MLCSSLLTILSQSSWLTEIIWKLCSHLAKREINQLIGSHVLSARKRQLLLLFNEAYKGIYDILETASHNNVS